mgnify:CR=1 FL=1
MLFRSFMSSTGEDVAWYKQGAYNVQLGRYKEILRDNYGIKEFGIAPFKKEPISNQINFNGQLRDYQIPIVDKILKYLKDKTLQTVKHF